MAEMEELGDSVGGVDGNGEVQTWSMKRRSRSSSPSFGLGEGFRASQSPCGVGLGNALQLPNENRVLCGHFEHQKHVQFEGCVAEPFGTITAILPGSKWSCLLLRIVLQDELSEVSKIYLPLKLRVFVDDITALLMVKNKVVAEMAKKV